VILKQGIGRSVPVLAVGTIRTRVLVLDVIAVTDNLCSGGSRIWYSRKGAQNLSRIALSDCTFNKVNP